MCKKILKVLVERYIPLLLTAGVAIFGWHVVDDLASKRDRANKQRDLRIEYLIGTYSRLSGALWRDAKPGCQYYRDMESAVADIQLFGTDSQIEKSNKMMDEFQKTKYGPLNSLLTELRDDLRQEMDLSKIEGDVRWFRPEGVPISPATTEKR